MNRRTITALATAALVLLMCLALPSTHSKTMASQQVGYVPGTERIANGNFSQPGQTSDMAANWNPGFPQWDGWGGCTREKQLDGSFALRITADDNKWIAGAYQTIELNHTAVVPMTFIVKGKSGPIAHVAADGLNTPERPHLGLTAQVKAEMADGEIRWFVHYPFFPPESLDEWEIPVPLDPFRLDKPIRRVHVFVGIIRGAGTVLVQSVSAKEYPRITSGVVWHLDDGRKSQLVAYRQHFHPRQWPVMIFPRVDWAASGNAEYLSWDDLREIRDDRQNVPGAKRNGFGSHAVTHLDFGKAYNGTETPAEFNEWLASATFISQKYGIPMPDVRNPIARIKWELENSDKILVDELCLPIYHFAFPFGAGNVDAYLQVLAACNYDTQRNAETGSNPRGVHPRRIFVQPLQRGISKDLVHMIHMWAKQDKLIIQWLVHDITDNPNDPSSCPPDLLEYTIKDIEYWGLDVLTYDEALRMHGDRERMFPADQHAPSRLATPVRPRANGGRGEGDRRMN